MKPDIEELRDLRDGITELVDNLNTPFCTASETILGYLVINGVRAQITLKAETDEYEWIGD